MFQGRRNVGEKKQWSSVRSYLCGDEFNSVLAVDDSGSIKDSVDALLTMSQQLISDSVSVKQHLEDDEEGLCISKELRGFSNPAFRRQDINSKRRC